MRLFNLNTIGKGEVAVVVTGSLLFLLVQYYVVGLIAAHVVMAVLFVALYLAHPVSRKVALAMLPFIVFEISYDWMRLYPNYRVNPIDVSGLYETELQLFGVSSEGSSMIPGQYFLHHHNSVADFFAGVFYLCWVPGPIALGLWLLWKRRCQEYVRFALCFLLVNFIGFAGYYMHPAAPPWYALEFGFEPILSTPGNAAGLTRFDDLIGIPVFSSIYVNNSNIFAAVPSLHAAYMLIATAYAVISHRSRWLIGVCAVITAGIWWTAVYSCHHYIIDVVLGILTAFAGIALLEQVLMRWRPFRHFVDRYAALL